ncbi:RagB/SusD family nutrient uptake outer membrane protein [Flammeovirga sp. EKP202]|uniref:RagB/SusD family nutrient uptake outer membrane protein n=1 Tax=Flammeovirga sp. EKP202 TaxID=2770592 RepID=UPI00165F3C31|nr:RagB/SusD family nutrient uptake outer membrane protein [Flammeovirga sp. EKP202]MBD0404227.1 RagB/SusD family nutrient uptake outer membrane protein [Flammeovirga sp. EKP202]
MKKTIINKIALLILTAFSLSCSNEFRPPFLDTESTYSTPSGQFAALNGMYGTMISFHAYANQMQALNLHSGLFYSGRESDNFGIAALNPFSDNDYVESIWQGTYGTINSANDFIYNVNKVYDNNVDVMSDDTKNYLGQAYFVRAFSYFNAVQMWGEVPLRVEPTNENTVHVGRTDKQLIFDQIIEDLNFAKTLMANDTQTLGYPKSYAANFLLSKVYVYIASCTNAGDEALKIEGYTNSGDDYWLMAYDEAKIVENQYSLVPNYEDLWHEQSGNNTDESIFELQFNITAVNKTFTFFYTPKVYTQGFSHSGRVLTNPAAYDLIYNDSPNDPRLKSTFVTSFVGFRDQGGNITENPYITKCYPESPVRTNRTNGFTPLLKLMEKNQYSTTITSNKNWIVYRYADLLLMLAEIQNERGLGADALQYVNLVLDRARNSNEGSAEPANWDMMSMEEMRLKLFTQRRAELLGEGQDWMDTRRRGYQFFKTNVIDPQNAFRMGENGNTNLDPAFPDNAKALRLPIPQVEINTNQAVSGSDQNEGYGAL